MMEVKWYTTSMKIPKIGEMVLIQHEYGGRRLDVAVWDGERFECKTSQWVQEAFDCDEVTICFSDVATVAAWCPFPQPPYEIEESEEE